VAFVLSLGSRKLFLYQFSQFGYCHMALLLVVGQSTLLAANVMNGFMWYVSLCVERSLSLASPLVVSSQVRRPMWACGHQRLLRVRVWVLFRQDGA
jgi:hypothetical protein